MTLFTGEEPDACAQPAGFFPSLTVTHCVLDGICQKIWNFKKEGWFTWMHRSGLFNPVALIPSAKPLFVVQTCAGGQPQTEVAPLSAPGWCMAEVLALATPLCDASQYLVTTVRNKLVYSRYIHSPPRGEIQSQLREPLKVQRKSIHNPAAQVIAYFVLLCYFFWQSHNDAWYK